MGNGGNMKRIILGVTALAMCVALVGCGSTNSNACLTNLGSQIDDTANIISNVQTVNPTELNLSKEMLEQIATKENNNAIYDNVISAQQTLLSEEYYKMDILNRTAKIKNTLSKDIKLSKSQSSALKELTENLSKYSNSVAYTKNDMNNTLRQLSSLKRNIQKNSDNINAKLNRLACNSNSRSAYYENILNTLAQIEYYLNIQENDSSAPKTEGASNENTGIENINTERIESQTTENEPTTMDRTPYNTFNSNNVNRINMPYLGYGMPYGGGFYSPYGYGGYPNGFGINNMGYGYGYGMNGFGGFANNRYIGNGYSGNGMFGSLYGGNGAFGRYNPYRNTDTYAPLLRNIDTYKTPNGVYTRGSFVVKYPEKRLENYEKVNEDNTVEKIEDDELSNNTINLEKKQPPVPQEEPTQDFALEMETDKASENVPEQECDECLDKTCENCEETSQFQTNKEKDNISSKLKLKQVQGKPYNQDELRQPIIAH